VNSPWDPSNTVAHQHLSLHFWSYRLQKYCGFSVLKAFTKSYNLHNGWQNSTFCCLMGLWIRPVTKSEPFSSLGIVRAYFLQTGCHSSHPPTMAKHSWKSGLHNKNIKVIIIYSVLQSVWQTENKINIIIYMYFKKSNSINHITLYGDWGH